MTAGISKVGICVNIGVWGGFQISSSMEAGVQSYWLSGNNIHYFVIIMPLSKVVYHTWMLNWCKNYWLQVDVAVRDNAQRLFNAELTKIGSGNLVHWLVVKFPTKFFQFKWAVQGYKWPLVRFALYEVVLIFCVLLADIWNYCTSCQDWVAFVPFHEFRFLPKSNSYVKWDMFLSNCIGLSGRY